MENLIEGLTRYLGKAPPRPPGLDAPLRDKLLAVPSTNIEDRRGQFGPIFEGLTAADIAANHALRARAKEPADPRLLGPSDLDNLATDAARRLMEKRIGM
jgi:hypothetical protein